MKKIRHGLRAIGRGLTATFRWLWRWSGKGVRSLRSGRVLLSIAALGVAFAIGIAVSQAWSSDDSDNADPVSPVSTSQGSSQPTSTAPEPNDDQPSSAASDPLASSQANSTASDPGDEPASSNLPDTTDSVAAAPAPTPTPVVVVLEQEPPDLELALAIATGLAPFTIYPSDCMSPLPHPDLLPNAPRAYRFGIHQGVDFQCFSLGRSAVAALDGRVVLAVGNYQDPDPDDRNELLEIAGELEATPPFTLLALYGNYVVIDHGIFPYIGHVVTLYAHLHEVDPNIRVGQTIKAGQRVGEIGNKGTHAAANGDFYNDPHLHWELHINNLYLGAGLSAEQTREVYTTLFSEAN